MVVHGPEPRQSKPRTYMLLAQASPSSATLSGKDDKNAVGTRHWLWKENTSPQAYWRGIYNELPWRDHEYLQPPCATPGCLVTSVSHILLEKHSLVFLWDMFSSFTVIQGGKSLTVFLLWLKKRQRKKSRSPKFREKVSGEAKVASAPPKFSAVS